GQAAPGRRSGMGTEPWNPVRLSSLPTALQGESAERCHFSVSPILPHRYDAIQVKMSLEQAEGSRTAGFAAHSKYGLAATRSPRSGAVPFKKMHWTRRVQLGRSPAETSASWNWGLPMRNLLALIGALVIEIGRASCRERV